MMNQFDRSADRVAGDRIADQDGMAAFLASLPCDDRRRDHHDARLALWRRCVVVACSTLVILLMVAVVAATIWLRVRNKDHPPPRYYAAIVTADLDIGRHPDGTVSTSFDLSLGVAASRGNLLTCGGYCLESGTTVQVSYRGAPLAREVVAAWEEVCALWWRPPGNTQWARIVVAENNITALPGVVADALVADARNGVRVFDVSMSMPDGKTTAWCGARRVGDKDKTAALCELHYPTTLSD